MNPGLRRFRILSGRIRIFVRLFHDPFQVFSTRGLEFIKEAVQFFNPNLMNRNS